METGWRPSETTLRYPAGYALFNPGYTFMSMNFSPDGSFIHRCRHACVKATGVTAVGLCMSVAAILAIPDSSHAFNDLTPAQKLIYDSSHLANTSAGQSLTYQYSSKSGDTQSDDKITLSVNREHDDDKRDVVLNFLSGEHRMVFPDFNQFRGNPVIIAMMEHVAQSIGRDTGGGVLYFRNRIRDALAAEAVLVSEEEMTWDGSSIKTTELVLSPFIRDSYLAERPEYRYAEIFIKLSEQVPGGVVGISFISRHEGLFYFSRDLELTPPGA